MLESVPRTGKRHHVETSDTQFGRKKVTSCAFAPRFKNLGQFDGIIFVRLAFYVSPPPSVLVSAANKRRDSELLAKVMDPPR